MTDRSSVRLQGILCFLHCQFRHFSFVDFFRFSNAQTHGLSKMFRQYSRRRDFLTVHPRCRQRTERHTRSQLFRQGHGQCGLARPRRTDQHDGTSRDTLFLNQITPETECIAGGALSSETAGIAVESSNVRVCGNAVGVAGGGGLVRESHRRSFGCCCGGHVSIRIEKGKKMYNDNGKLQ